MALAALAALTFDVERGDSARSNRPPEDQHGPSEDEGLRSVSPASLGSSRDPHLEERREQPSSNPAIARIEDEFPVGGKRFSALDPESLPLEEADRVLSEIRKYQADERRRLFESRPVETMRTISVEEFYAGQYFLFPELMLFPLDRQGHPGEYAVLEERDSPTLYGLREMARAICSAGPRHELDQKRLEESLARLREDRPDVLIVESPFQEEVYGFDPQGKPVFGHCINTLGN